MDHASDSALSAGAPAFLLDGGSGDRGCILAAPHAGRAYPVLLSQMLRVPAHNLQKLEDRYSDLLLRDAAACGFATLIAAVPRAMIDLNRPLGDFDFDMIHPDEAGQLVAAGMRRGGLSSARVRGGLGLVPRRLATCGELWKRRLGAAELLARIRHVHTPYHDTLEHALDGLVARRGVAVLIDVHSMPPLPVRRTGSAADVVIGDLHGTSANAAIVEAIVDVSASHGLKVVRNNPYAGGHVLRRHGKPRIGRHAVQVEFDRRLYLDDRLTEPGPGLGQIQAIIAEMAHAVEATAIGGGRLAEAAE